MTNPTLLRLVRWCQKWAGGFLLVATLFLVAAGLFAGGNVAWAGALNHPAVTPTGGPKNLKVKGSLLMLPGDSLTYVLSWGAATKATGYKVSLAASATNGTWTATGFALTPTTLPASVGPSPGTSFTFTAISTTADSVSFTATVESADALGLTGKTASVSWKVKRRAGAPGPITVDSSRAVGTIVLPNTWTLSIGQSRILCAFKVFTSGAIAEWTADKPACDSIYTSYVPLAWRSAVTAGEQAHTDSTGVTCVTWSSNTVAVSVLPNGTCSSAARVTGVSLTYRPLSPGVREALGHVGIASEWMGLPIAALW